LAFIHSHPNSPSADLSPLDIETSSRLARVCGELLDGPFVSLVISPTDWKAVAASDDHLEAIDRIAIAGRRLAIYGVSLSVPDPALDDRQLRAMSAPAHAALRDLRVGVIGVGGLGSPVAETLARMGVGELRLVDNDRLDTTSNARRIFGVSRADVEISPPQLKAEVVRRHLVRLGLGSHVTSIVGDIRDRDVQDELLDLDVLISGTDTHSSRAALAELSVRAAMPLIDIGVRVGVRTHGQLDALRFERRVQIPDGPCLWCWGVLDAERVRSETLPAHQRQVLVREGYVTGSSEAPAPSVACLTVMAAGAATSALLAMIAGAFDYSPLAVGVDTITLESTPFKRSHPDPQCICSRWSSA
jgi:molybdopterin/thiamine biosynthesis adenylyltransferase